MKTNEIRAAAIDETKIGGDTTKAIALALTYIGDILSRNDGIAMANAIDRAGADIAGELRALAAEAAR